MKLTNKNIEKVTRDNGSRYVLYGMFANIKKGMSNQKAFFEACENENYYGELKHVVHERRMIAFTLEDKFNIKVSYTEGF